MAKQSGNVVKKAIQIDAGTSVRTVKSLKQEISDLRDALLNLDKETQEYTDTQEKLQQDVHDLNEVMNAHKDSAKALEGSYNDLQNQLKELKTVWKETNDEAERNEIGAQINNLNNKLKEMDASIGDFHRNVGNYQSAWDGLSGVMEKSEHITDDLEKGIKAFGTAVGMTDSQVSRLSKSLKSLKDGFKIAKDIAKAKENTEKLATAEQKAAGAGAAMANSQKAAGTAAKTMAASEGAATVATKGLSVAMKGLKVALISTGIGALIAALGSLIGLLDKAISKSKEARLEAIKSSTDNQVSVIKEQIENLGKLADAREFDRRKMEAAGASAMQLLEQEKEDLESLRGWYVDNERVAKKYYVDKKKFVEGLPKKRQDEYTESLESLEAAWKDATDALNDFDKEIVRVEQDIEIQKIKDANKNIGNTTEELKKWSDTIQNPKFQQAWKAIFNTPVDESQSPVDRLKEQYAAALKLTNAWKTETGEVDAFFKNMIADAEDTFKSIRDMEDKMYLEGLTPLEQLEREKNEWLAKYEEWQQDTYNLVKYYDEKIAKARQDAIDEELAKAEAARQKELDELNNFMSQVEGTLDSQEKLNAIFNPMYMTDTASGDIEQEMENLQNLYNTQMEYLNSLLESAELTEEAYGAVEDRILSLTVSFNSQMNVLKKEQEQQGKNFALLTRKQVSNFSLMEQAAGDYADAFQTLGLENSVAYKGFASAQALISALLAANRVLAEEPGGVVIKGIAAAAALAAGIANLVAIWAVDPSGSNAQSAAGSVGMQATPVIGYSQPINYTRNITSAEEEDALNQPIYVTVTDIEDGINGRKAEVTNSSF